MMSRVMKFRKYKGSKSQFYFKGFVNWLLPAFMFKRKLLAELEKNRVLYQKF